MAPLGAVLILVSELLVSLIGLQCQCQLNRLQTGSLPADAGFSSIRYHSLPALVDRRCLPSCNTVRLQQGRNRKVISWRGCFLHTLPSLSFPFSLPLFSPPRSGPSNPAKGFGERCWLPKREIENICSHQTCPLGSKYTKKMRLRTGLQANAFFYVFRGRERVWWLRMSTCFC